MLCVCGSSVLILRSPRRLPSPEPLRVPAVRSGVRTRSEGATGLCGFTVAGAVGSLLRAAERSRSRDDRDLRSGAARPVETVVREESGFCGWDTVCCGSVAEGTAGLGESCPAGAGARLSVIRLVGEFLPALVSAGGLMVLLSTAGSAGFCGTATLSLVFGESAEGVCGLVPSLVESRSDLPLPGALSATEGDGVAPEGLCGLAGAVTVLDGSGGRLGSAGSCAGLAGISRGCVAMRSCSDLREALLRSETLGEVACGAGFATFSGAPIRLPMLLLSIKPGESLRRG